MSTLATTTPKQSALAVMASRFSVEPAKLLSTLKSTVFKGASDDELLALCIVANEYGLNPITKEIYAFPAKGGGIVPVVSVDGWINIVNSHPQMDGLEFEMHDGPDGEPVSCTAIIWRKDRTRPIKVTEYFSEVRRNTEPWKMARRMLRHKALIQCARVAFGFSGVYDEDEAEDIKAVTGRVISKPVFTEPEKPAALPFTEPTKEASPAPEDKPKRQRKADDAPAPKATPLEGVRNLCKASGVGEADALAFLNAQFDTDMRRLEDFERLDPSALETLCDRWADVLPKIKELAAVTAGGAE